MSKEYTQTHVTAPLRIDPACGMTDVPELNREGTDFVNFGVTLFSDSGTRCRQLKLTTELTGGPEIVFIHNGQPIPLQDKAGDSLFILPRSIINRHKESHPEANSLTIRVEDNLPTGTGLGGSASLSVVFHVGLENALATAQGEIYDPDPNDVIQRAHHLEVDELGIMGGFQDYIGAYFGNLNRVNVTSLDQVDLTASPTVGTPMENEVKTYFNSHLLILLRKRGNISSSMVVEDAVSRCMNNANSSRSKLKEIISGNKRMHVLLSTPASLTDRLEEIGEIMNRSWILHKSLSPLIGSIDLSEWEGLVKPYVYGVQGPGTGANSIVLLTRENGNDQIMQVLDPYKKDVEILSAQVNETGVSIS